MSEKETGGPAFPVLGSEGERHAADGMTLCDYFAARALTATVNMKHEELQEFTGEYEEGTTCDLAALAAYQMAYSMLKVRNGA